MSANTLRDPNMLPESENKTETESSTNGEFYKPQTEHTEENREERKNSCPLVEISPNENGALVSGTEAASVEVEYIESENLDDVEDVDTSLEARVYFNCKILCNCSYSVLHIYSTIGLFILIVSLFLFQILLVGLESKDWVVVCGALNNVRRLSLFHKELLHEKL